jgi:thioredoxin-like negative regulator of GroEL
MQTIKVNNYNKMLDGMQSGRKYALIKFTSKACRACKNLEPRIAKLDLDIDVYDVNHDENQVISRSFSIQSLPTVVFCEDGIPSARMTGLNQSKDFLKLVGQVVNGESCFVDWDM